MPRSGLIPKNADRSLATVAEVSIPTTDPNLRRIKVGGKTVMTLPRSDFEALGIAEGTPWTAELQNKAEQARLKVAAQKLALRLLGRRAYSKGELREKLQRREFSSAIVDDILQHLERDGWIDDAAYGRAVIDATIRSRPASTEFIVQKLRRKKISTTLAQELVHSFKDTHSPEQQALGLAQETLPRLANLTRPAQTRRLANALARRGFDEETISNTLQHVFGDSSGDVS